jgi:5-methylcytosine-specific restriction protein B
MNTADRSIAALDTALRRRFQFREMLPDAKVLDGIMVEDLSVKEMLLTMNRRIAVLYDREHTIGHAYFVPLRQNPSIDLLGEIFRNRILPLLQEYFYEDYEKIRMVLGDNQKSEDEPKFVEVEKDDYKNLFGKTEFDFEGIRTYRINEDAFCDPDAYRLML